MAQNSLPLSLSANTDEIPVSWDDSEVRSHHLNRSLSSASEEQYKHYVYAKLLNFFHQPLWKLQIHAFFLSHYCVLYLVIQSTHIKSDLEMRNSIYFFLICINLLSTLWALSSLVPPVMLDRLATYMELTKAN